MNTYHKINSIFKRNTDLKHNPMIPWDWSQPEFEYLAHTEWEFTEKVDGTNIRLMWDGQDLSIGGKTDNAQIPQGLVEWFMRHKEQHLETYREKFGETKVCLYGEGCGPKIQKVGHLYGDHQYVVLFDVLIGFWWLKREDVIDVARKLDLHSAPVVGWGNLIEGVQLVKNGFYSTWGDFMAEGIVARPKVELFDRSGKRIITKIKHKDLIDLDV